MSVAKLSRPFVSRQSLKGTVEPHAWSHTRPSTSSLLMTKSSRHLAYPPFASTSGRSRTSVIKTEPIHILGSENEAKAARRY